MKLIQKGKFVNPDDIRKSISSFDYQSLERKVIVDANFQIVSHSLRELDGVEWTSVAPLPRNRKDIVIGENLCFCCMHNSLVLQHDNNQLTVEVDDPHSIYLNLAISHLLELGFHPMENGHRMVWKGDSVV